MFCPQCRTEYREGFVECSDCHVSLTDRLPEPETPVDLSVNAHEQSGEGDLDLPISEGDLDALIRTGLKDPLAIGLAKALLQEAGIPFFVMDQNVAARQESGNLFGWWTVRVPREKEAGAREILQSVEETG